MKKFEAQAKLRSLGAIMQDHYTELQTNPLSNTEELKMFNETFAEYTDMLKDLKGLKVSDDLITTHSKIYKEHEGRHKDLGKKLMIATTMIED